MLEFTDEIVDRLIDVTYRAGAITLKYFREDVAIQIKDNDSPVTKADQQAEAAILEVIRDIHPDIPIVAEEEVSAGRYPDYQSLNDFWLIDPLDGTKEFINDRKDYTVNIAYMRNKEPYFGVVFAPARDLMFYGFSDHEHAFMVEGKRDEAKPVKIMGRSLNPNDPINLVTSLSQAEKEDFQAYIADYDVAEMKKYGSSLKFCAIAAGYADLYPRFKPTSEWDTAAAHAIMRATGGDIFTIDGKPLQYAKRGDFLNPYFIAKSKSLIERDR